LFLFDDFGRSRRSKFSHAIALPCTPRRSVPRLRYWHGWFTPHDANNRFGTHSDGINPATIRQ